MLNKTQQVLLKHHHKFWLFGDATDSSEKDTNVFNDVIEIAEEKALLKSHKFDSKIDE